MIQLCRRIFRNNRQCGQPAVNGSFFCRHHRDVKDWKRRSGLRSQIRIETPTQTYDHGTASCSRPTYPPLDLEFPEDPAAILTNIYRVTTLLVQGHIDRPTANSVTYGMQVCLSALNGKPLFEPAASAPARSQSRSCDTDSDPDSETTYTDPGCPTSGRSDVGSRPVHRIILTPDGDEIAPPVEILEDNEADPIHHKGCPCLLCAEKYRNHPPEEHHPNCQCGLCEEQETEDEEKGLREQGSEYCDQATVPGAPRPDSRTWDPETSTNLGAPSFAHRGPQHARGSCDGVEERRAGSDTPASMTLSPVLCSPSSRRARSASGISPLRIHQSRPPQPPLVRRRIHLWRCHPPPRSPVRRSRRRCPGRRHRAAAVRALHHGTHPARPPRLRRRPADAAALQRILGRPLPQTHRRTTRHTGISRGRRTGRIRSNN